MIIICDICALRIHARYRARMAPCPVVGSVVPTASLDDLALIDADQFKRQFGVMHLIVSSPEDRIRSSSLSSHMCSEPLPAASILIVKEGVGVASIALTTVLMSRSMDDYALTRLLYELCATHRVSDYRHTYKPLITKEQLARELATLSGIRGASRVIGLLAYVADGSASPRETDLAMLAWLPHRLGGFGLPMGEMNKKVPNSDIDRKCDLWFPKARLGVEYESDECHSGETNISRDSARRAQIGNKGYRVITITNGEIRDEELAFESMRFLGKQLGVRVRKPQGKNAVRRRELLAFIRTPHVPYF